MEDRGGTFEGRGYVNVTIRTVVNRIFEKQRRGGRGWTVVRITSRNHPAAAGEKKGSAANSIDVRSPSIGIKM
jgi:hypothetical protein